MVPLGHLECVFQRFKANYICGGTLSGVGGGGGGGWGKYTKIMLQKCKNHAIMMNKMLTII